MHLVLTERVDLMFQWHSCLLQSHVDILLLCFNWLFKEIVSLNPRFKFCLKKKKIKDVCRNYKALYCKMFS